MLAIKCKEYQSNYQLCLKWCMIQKQALSNRVSLGGGIEPSIKKIDTHSLGGRNDLLRKLDTKWCHKLSGVCDHQCLQLLLVMKEVHTKKLYAWYRELCGVQCALYKDAWSELLIMYSSRRCPGILHCDVGNIRNFVDETHIPVLLQMQCKCFMCGLCARNIAHLLASSTHHPDTLHPVGPTLLDTGMPTG